MLTVKCIHMAAPLTEEFPLNKLVPVRLDAHTYQDLIVLVNYEGTTQTQIARQAIRQYIQGELQKLELSQEKTDS